MFFGEVPLSEAVGAILAHSRKLKGRSIKKGHVLTHDDIAELSKLGLQQIVVARLEADDVPENEAAAAIAKAVCGAGLSIGKSFTGRTNLFATVKGLLVVDEDALAAVNRVDESITIASLANSTVVAESQMVATIKIIPFSAQKSAIDSCLRHASLNKGVIRQLPFLKQRAVMIQTELPDTSNRMLDKTTEVMRRRLARLDIDLAIDHRCPHTSDALSQLLRELSESDLDMILVAGASAIVDRRDVIPSALMRSGGIVSHFGMPVDPGNLLMTGALSDHHVIGLPGCARSPKYNGLDMVLERLAVGLPVDSNYVMGLGASGLLKETVLRPQPRAGGSALQTSLSSKTVSAVVLAAGQSRRMGKDNKLLMTVGGQAMLSHAVKAAIDSQVTEIIVVTGHERDEIERLVTSMVSEKDKSRLKFVHNANYREGLSTSIHAGLSVISDSAAGFVICLSDMPAVAGGHIDSLIDAFDPLEGRHICVPTVDGKRGNPVLWSMDYKDDILAVSGDTGARHLIGDNEEAVVEVAMSDAATVTDVDTPDVLRLMREISTNR